MPKSTMEGEQSWPTQPVPTKPAAYIKHTFTVDDINPHLPAEEAAALKARLLAADNNGIFAPITTKDTVSVPASNGGTLFAGAAAEPRTGAVYLVAHDNPGIVRLLRPGEGRALRRPGAAGAGRLPAELPGLPRRQPPGHRYRRAARARRRRSGQQHRRRRAPFRRRRHSRRADHRQEPHAAVPASEPRRRRQSRQSADGGGRRVARRVSRPWHPPRCVRRTAGVDRRLRFRVAPPGRAWRSRSRRRAVSRRDARLHALHDQRVPHRRQRHPAAVHHDREVRPERAGHQVADSLRRRSRARRPRHHAAPARRRPTTASS